MRIGLKEGIFLQLWLLFSEISRMNLTQPLPSTSAVLCCNVSALDNAELTLEKAVPLQKLIFTPPMSKQHSHILHHF